MAARADSRTSAAPRSIPAPCMIEKWLSKSAVPMALVRKPPALGQEAAVLQGADLKAAGLLQPATAVPALRPGKHRPGIERVDVVPGDQLDDVDRDLSPARRTGQRPRRPAGQGVGQR